MPPDERQLRGRFSRSRTCRRRESLWRADFSAALRKRPHRGSRAAGINTVKQVIERQVHLLLSRRLMELTMFDQSLRRVPLARCDQERQLRARIRGEYQEMPGLSLTLSQAVRLFNVEPTECARVLDTLVTEGALWTNGSRFVCRNVGRRTA
jgi:hypothetical protein